MIIIKCKYRDKIRFPIRKTLIHSSLCSFLTLTGCSKAAHHLGMQNVEEKHPQKSIDGDSSRLDQNHILLRIASDDDKVKVLQGTIPTDSDAIGKKLADPALKLPESVLIGLIKRGSAYVIPRGETPIQAADELMVVTEMQETQETIEKVQKQLGIKEPLNIIDSSQPNKNQLLLESAIDDCQVANMQVTIPKHAAVIDKKLADPALKLPESVLIELIKRDNDYTIPRGETDIRAADVLEIIAKTQEKEDLNAVKQQLERLRIVD